MKTEAKTPRQYWATPVLGLVIGIVYQRSETVRGLLDRRDERITGIDP